MFDGFGGAGCGIASSDEGTVVIDLGAASSADLELRLMRDNPNAPDFLFDDEGLALYRAEIYVR